MTNKMAKHHRHQNINRSPRLSYLTSHSQSQSFMSEGGGEMAEMLSLDESENLLSERYSGSASAIQVISGSAYNGSGLGSTLTMSGGPSHLQHQQRLEELGISYSDGGFNSKLLSPAVTIVEMTAGGLLPNSGNLRHKNHHKHRLPPSGAASATAAAAAAVAASTEQTTLNAIGKFAKGHTPVEPLSITDFFVSVSTGLFLCLGLQMSVDRGGPQEWGEATRSYVKAQRRHAGRATFQGQVYNFLERPAGYKCFIYHVSV
ncbi:uncharacterized protein LOC128735213 [Sabethes cyaneus]|uniref:uncharacterized protein LOC128735213 n=1 Tax=Sabethes cyaneus TaxID=53552 RepID=UPI00237E66E6|nr:uncharacterized protein LOC128735213 [Sabethes cyaneus]